MRSTWSSTVPSDTVGAVPGNCPGRSSALMLATLALGGWRTEHRARVESAWSALVVQRHLADHPDTAPEGPVALDHESGRLLQRRGAVGEPGVEVADELVVRGVEVDEGHLLGDLLDPGLGREPVAVGPEH